MAKIFAGLGNELGAPGISPVTGRAYTGATEMTLQEASMAAENTNNSITKIALVTGGSRGLGRNTALSLARKGVDVVITYHSNQAEADSTVAAIKKLGRNAAALQLDTGAIKTFPDFAARLQATLKDK